MQPIVNNRPPTTSIERACQLKWAATALVIIGVVLCIFSIAFYTGQFQLPNAALNQAVALSLILGGVGLFSLSIIAHLVRRRTLRQENAEPVETIEEVRQRVDALAERQRVEAKERVARRRSEINEKRTDLGLPPLGK